MGLCFSCLKLKDNNKRILHAKSGRVSIRQPGQRGDDVKLIRMVKNNKERSNPMEKVGLNENEDPDDSEAGKKRLIQMLLEDQKSLNKKMHYANFEVPPDPSIKQKITHQIQIENPSVLKQNHDFEEQKGPKPEINNKPEELVSSVHFQNPEPLQRMASPIKSVSNVHTTSKANHHSQTTKNNTNSLNVHFEFVSSQIDSVKETPLRTLEQFGLDQPSLHKIVMAAKPNGNSSEVAPSKVNNIGQKEESLTPGKKNLTNKVSPSLPLHLSQDLNQSSQRVIQKPPNLLAAVQRKSQNNITDSLNSIDQSKVYADSGGYRFSDLNSRRSDRFKTISESKAESGFTNLVTKQEGPVTSINVIFSNQYQKKQTFLQMKKRNKTTSDAEKEFTTNSLFQEPHHPKEENKDDQDSSKVREDIEPNREQNKKTTSVGQALLNLRSRSPPGKSSPFKPTFKKFEGIVPLPEESYENDPDSVVKFSQKADQTDLSKLRESSLSGVEQSKIPITVDVEAYQQRMNSQLVNTQRYRQEAHGSEIGIISEQVSQEEREDLDESYQGGSRNSLDLNPLNNKNQIMIDMKKRNRTDAFPDSRGNQVGLFGYGGNEGENDDEEYSMDFEDDE